MKELKTLKDIEEEVNFVGADKEYLLFKIKAEAVKWVKNKENLDFNMYEIKEWIKHFFNINEDDLQ